MPVTTINIRFFVNSATIIVGIAAKQYSRLNSGNEPDLTINRFCTNKAVNIHIGT